MAERCSREIRRKALLGTRFQPAGGGRRHFSVMRGGEWQDGVLGISMAPYACNQRRGRIRFDAKAVVGRASRRTDPAGGARNEDRAPWPAALVAAFRLSCGAPSRQWQLVAISIFFSMACGGIYEASGVIRFRRSPVVKGVERTSLSCALVSFDLI